jgi:hypothetical protein
MAVMTELALLVDKDHFQEDGNIEKQKEEAITRCRRRINAARELFLDGDARMDRAEFLRVKESNEREIAHWEMRTTETTKLALELAVCFEAIDQLLACGKLIVLKIGVALSRVCSNTSSTIWMSSVLLTFG